MFIDDDINRLEGEGHSTCLVCKGSNIFFCKVSELPWSVYLLRGIGQLCGAGVAEMLEHSHRISKGDDKSLCIDFVGIAKLMQGTMPCG